MSSESCKTGAWLLALAFSSPLWAEPNHMLEYLLPRGGTVGTNVRVTLHGRYIDEPKEILFYDQDIKAVNVSLVEAPEPKPAGPVRAVGRQCLRERAVERRAPGGRHEPGGTQPGRPKRGWLLEFEGGLLEAEPQAEAGGVRLGVQHPGQPEKAAQGDQEACHSRGSRRSLRMRDRPNIMRGTNPYNHMS